MKKSSIEKLKNRFLDGSIIDLKTLNQFIDEEFESSKGKRFAIFDLTRTNIIYQLNSDHYKISSRKTYRTDPPLHVLPTVNDLSLLYPELEICVWDLKSLNPFLEMQVFRNIIFVEVEKGYETLVLESLSQDKQFNILFKPTVKQMESFINLDSTIILKTLITKAPTHKKRFSKNVGFNQHYHGDKSSLSTPKIEKIMVDLFTDPLFYMIDEPQRDLIFRNILRECAVNFKTLLSYARNRNKKETIREYIEQHLGFEIDRGEFYDQREKL